ncbi:hypothetical protein HDV02_004983 [Globomyces sp. JEL0801]|nr:hypothetical protein HDV02_004983 [Globomyces sp. JEL0801]
MKFNEKVTDKKIMTDPLDEQEDLKQIDANGIIDSDNIDKNLIADNQWIVNKILDYRQLRGNEEYLIQWKNYLELTWEPIEKLIINYWNERKDLESPDSSDDWEELVTRVQEIEITTM